MCRARRWRRTIAIPALKASSNSSLLEFLLALVFGSKQLRRCSANSILRFGELNWAEYTTSARAWKAWCWFWRCLLSGYVASRVISGENYCFSFLLSFVFTSLREYSSLVDLYIRAFHVNLSWGGKCFPVLFLVMVRGFSCFWRKLFFFSFVLIFMYIFSNKWIYIT